MTQLDALGLFVDDSPHSEILSRVTQHADIDRVVKWKI